MTMTKLRRASVCALLVIAGVACAHPPDSHRMPLALRIAKEGRQGFESTLQKEGYPTETVAQLQNAAKNGGRAGVRWSALYLLADRIGQDGIPTFKDALKDPASYTRKTAALLLGALGDMSGVQVLRQDLAILAPRNGAPDPNMMSLQGDELKRAESRRFRRLYEAIQAAEALSQLGDPGGLALAAWVALEGEYTVHRKHAVATLANLVVRAASDRSVLIGQSIDPESVLVVVAGSETSPSVLAAVKTNAARLPRGTSRKIYERLVVSPHLREKDREMVRGYLRMFERQAARQAETERKQD